MWALLEAGIVKEITTIDPTGRFHSHMNWQRCPAGVEPGWAFDDGRYARASANLEALAVTERAWRDTYLSSTEWLMNRHRDELELEAVPTLSKAQYAELLALRQQLREWPASADFPQVAQRPSIPDWLGSVS